MSFSNSEVDKPGTLLGCLNKSITSQLTDPTQINAYNLAFQSAIAKKTYAPDKIAGSVLPFNHETVQTLNERVLLIQSDIPADLKIANKVIDPANYRREMIFAWIENFPEDQDLDAAFSQYIVNYDQTRRKLPAKILNSSTLIASRAWLGLRLLIANGGVRINRRLLKLSNKLVDFPIEHQFRQDLIEASSEVASEESYQQEISKICRLYGKGVSTLNIISHPDFAKRIIGSSLMNATIYTWPRQLFGWGSFGYFVSSPEFRNIFESNPIGSLAVSGVIVSGLVTARMAIDSYVLAKRQMSPDIIETTFANLKGCVTNENRLRANYRFGMIGAPLDVVISSLPPYSLAYLIEPRAYLLAIGVDQLVFTLTNLAYLIFSRPLEQKAKIGNAIKGTKN